MIHKKRIITQFIASIFLIGMAIIMQIFVKSEIATFMVAIILGIATGVIVAMVDCLQKNKSELDSTALVFERTICRILSCINNISNIDVYDEKIVDKVEMNLDKIYDYGQEMSKIVDALNLLLILPRKERKMQKIIDDIGRVFSFINCNYNFSSNLKRLDVSNSEYVSKMEALKAIKYMREYNPDAVLTYLQHSKNNVMKPNISDEECFYNIIFKDNIFDAYNRQCWDDIEKSELEELSKKYKRYDFSKVADRINQIPLHKWKFFTGTQKHIDKYLDDEDYYD